MLTKCANPACNTPFRRLRTGRLFQFEMGSSKEYDEAQVKRPIGAVCIYESPNQKGVRSIEHFWLCAACAPAMSLVRSPQGGSVLLVMQPERHQRAAAS